MSLVCFGSLETEIIASTHAKRFRAEHVKSRVDVEPEMKGRPMAAVLPFTRYVCLTDFRGHPKSGFET
jgi:hypothetical protein